MKQEREYPELEGTMALCKEMIEARAHESVQAPGEPASELHRVRKAKEQHVKEQNWELAAAYREIEKLLQDRERKCANCQYMLSAIGVGQGLICELNRCRIPHSEHSCQYHWYGPKEVTKSAETASFDSEPTTHDLTDEAIYAESEKRGYTQLATRLAWEDGAKWCRDALQR